MAAFAGLMLMFAALALFKALTAPLTVTIGPAPPPPSPPVVADPYPAYDETAFWLYPDWDAAGDRPFWMVPQKRPVEALSDYERGLAQGKALWAEIEGLAVHPEVKQVMRQRLAFQLAQNTVGSAQLQGAANARVTYRSIGVSTAGRVH